MIKRVISGLLCLVMLTIGAFSSPSFAMEVKADTLENANILNDDSVCLDGVMLTDSGDEDVSIDDEYEELDDEDIIENTRAEYEEIADEEIDDEEIVDEENDDEEIDAEKIDICDENKAENAAESFGKDEIKDWGAYSPKAVGALAAAAAAPVSTVHVHECEYVPDGMGNHIIRCKQKCGYERVESCTYIADKYHPNSDVCSVCKGLSAMYLWKNSKQSNVVLSNGEIGSICFGLRKTVEFSSSSDMAIYDDKGNIMFTIEGGKNQTTQGASEFKKVYFRTTTLECGEMTNRAGATPNGIYHRVFNNAGSSIANHKSPMFGFSTLLKSTAYDPNKESERYIDLASYDEVVLDYNLTAPSAEQFLAGLETKICDVAPYKTEAQTTTSEKSGHIRQYISLSDYINNNLHMGSPRGELSFAVKRKINDDGRTYMSALDAYAISKRSTDKTFGLNASIGANLSNKTCRYNENVTFSVGGKNFTNCRWYGIPKNSSTPIFLSNDLSYVNQVSATNTSSNINITANSTTDGMQIYFTAKGPDDTSYIKSNVVTLGVSNDPVVSVEVTNIPQPVADTALANTADYKIRTYKGAEIKGKYSLSWKSKYCANNELPCVSAGQKASYNTEYGVDVLCNSAVSDGSGGLKNPFIAGLFSVKANGVAINSSLYKITDSGASMNFEYANFVRTGKYPLSDAPDIKVDIENDKEASVTIDAAKIIKNAGYTKGDSPDKLITLDYTLTNQNRFSLNTEALKSCMIKITGTATRPGIVYEARFKLSSKLYSDVTFNVVVMAKEPEKEGLFGTLKAPGLYDGEKLLYEWTNLMSDELIDYAGTTLYGAGLNEENSKAVLVLSRKLTKIKKDALDKSNVKKLQFGNSIKTIGKNGLNGVENLYYEGSIDDWNDLIKASGDVISENDFTIHFIDYKKPVIRAEFGELVYDGNSKEAQSLDVFLACMPQYTFVAKDGILSNETYEKREDILPSEYELTYENNINAGNAKLIVTAKDGSFGMAEPFVINKAKIPKYDEENYKIKVNTFSQINNAFYLFDPLPLDAGMVTFNKLSETMAEHISANINTKGIVKVLGYSTSIGSLYTGEYRISSENYEDYEVKIIVEGKSLSDGAEAEFNGEKYDFKSLVKNSLIEIDKQGMISKINPYIKGNLSIPDYIESEGYSGYINGFSADSFYDLMLSGIVMDKCSHIKNIPESLFAKNENIETVILPDSLVNIENDAFRDCRNLKIVYMPDGVKTIGKRAFMNDTSMLSLSLSAFGMSLPKNLEILETGVFSGCANLGTKENPFVIPDSVKQIKGTALDGIMYLSYLGNKADMEKIISSYLLAIDRTDFNYTGQEIFYPTNIRSIEFTGDNKGVYEYENKPCQPGFVVKTYEGSSFVYEIAEEKFTTVEKLNESLENTYLSGGKGYTTQYFDNIEPGVGKVEIKGAGKYRGECEATFEIKKGRLDSLIGKKVVINTDSIGYVGIVKRTINANDYATGVIFGDDLSLELRDVKKNAKSQYSVSSSGEIAFDLSYELGKENEGTGTEIFSANAHLTSENFEDYDFLIAYEVTIAECSVKNVVYTGQELKPSVKVVFKDRVALPDLEYVCSYENNIEKGTATVKVDGVGIVLGSRNLEFEITPGSIVGNDDNDDEKDINKRRGGKNASIDYQYDEEGQLIYKVIEKVGCLIELYGDSYDIADYLPTDIGNTEYKLIGLESDNDEVMVEDDGDGKLTVDGYSEYPTNCIAKATYIVSSGNYGDFCVEFTLSSVRPITKTVKESVCTNVDLYSTKYNIKDYLSKDLIVESIRPVMLGGNYYKNVDYLDGCICLGQSTGDSGRIFYGSYAGRDDLYQSYKLNIYVDANNKTVSTKDKITKILPSDFRAEYVEGYIYTGKKITPALTIYDENGRELRYKKDYILKYKNNVKANLSPMGETIKQKYNKRTKTYSEIIPTITICYKGDYKRRKKDELHFAILQKDISSADIVYYEKKIAKSFKKGDFKFIKYLEDRDKNRIGSKEYRISYVNQDNNEPSKSSLPYQIKQIGNSGRRVVLRIEGKNNYYGQFDAIFEV